MIEKINKFREYLDYIEEHYNNVQKAWNLIQEKCFMKRLDFMDSSTIWTMINDDVKNHDLSKLSQEEFTQYRQYFYPCEEEEKDEKLMMKAWNHHKLVNLHHSEGWTKELKKGKYADAYVVMLVVDLVAMSFKFGGTAKEYYDNHKDEIVVSDENEELMYKIFRLIY